jgi:tetratricopeptide (TPR) repeat protein
VKPKELITKYAKVAVPALAIVVVGTGAYVWGSQQSKSKPHEQAELDFKAHPEAIAHQEPEHGSKDHGVEHGADRKPASAPKAVDEQDEYQREGEEVEVQIAHQRATEPEKLHQQQAHSDPVEPKKGFFATVFSDYRNFFKGLNEKVEALKSAEEDNRRLRLENAQLRVRLETEKYSCRIEESKKQAQKVGARLNAETGTHVGRTLASVSYQIPENLLPDQVQALGVSYFKAKDYEKAVTIFSFLTGMEDSTSFQTPDNFLMTGVAWYQLENYKLAGQYFERVLKTAVSAEHNKLAIQAKVWKALVAQKQKDYSQAQVWLDQTIDLHPQSEEARWINPQEGRRTPASTKKKKHEEAKKSDEKAHQETSHH